MRLDHFYGPFDKPNKFIAYLIKNMREDVPYLDLTEGSQKRDFIYIDDVVSAFLCVFKEISNLETGRVHNFEVCSGEKITIKEAVTTIKNLLGNSSTKLNFGAVQYRQNEVLEYNTDNGALKSLGWNPTTNFKEGIFKIIKEEAL
jgi:nucleoside-diphosphate-sugar epimerase